ncbi:MAG: lipopolysaccharide biosynthesis protein [Planctomycetota bacterium]
MNLVGTCEAAAGTREQQSPQQGRAPESTRLGRHATVTGLHGVLAVSCSAIGAGLLYRCLGTEFGVYALVTGGALTLNLFDDSIGAFVVTAVSRARRGDATLAKEPSSSGHARFDGLGAELTAALRAQVLGTGVLAIVFGSALGWLYAEHPLGTTIAVLGAFGSSVASGATFAAKILEGEERFVRLRLAQSACSMARLGVVAALVASGARDVTTFLAGFAVSYLAQLVVILVLARRTLSAWVWLRRVDRSTSAFDLFTFCRPLLVAKAAAVVSYRLDLWMIQALAGASATAAYALAEAVARLATQSLEVIKGVVLPVSVRRWHHDAAVNETFLLRATKASIGLTMGTCVCLFAALDPLLLTWFGAAPTTARVAAQLLLVFSALTSVRAVAQSILVGQSEFHRLAGHFVRAACLNAAVSFVAIEWWGAWGGALGTAVAGAYLLRANVGVAERTLRLAAGTFDRRLLAPSLAAAAAAVLVPRCLLPAPTTAIEGLAHGTLAGCIFVGLSWCWLLDRSERCWILRRGNREAPALASPASLPPEPPRAIDGMGPAGGTE